MKVDLEQPIDNNRGFGEAEQHGLRMIVIPALVLAPIFCYVFNADSSDSRYVDFEFDYNGQAADEFRDELSRRVREHRDIGVDGVHVTHAEKTEFYLDFLENQGLTVETGGRIFNQNQERVYHNQLLELLVDYRPTR